MLNRRDAGDVAWTYPWTSQTPRKSNMYTIVILQLLIRGLLPGAGARTVLTMTPRDISAQDLQQGGSKTASGHSNKIIMDTCALRLRAGTELGPATPGMPRAYRKW